ncbi:MAG: phosphoribosylglycinamide formyltransferase [Myxococcales bacterium]|nr:phosphoribosylglycinamide formyltransferase [Myxococcales bacterium]
MSAPERLAVFVSGGGTNLQAILDACRQPGYPAEVAVVACNVAGAFGMERARRAGVPVVLVPHRDFRSRAEHERAVLDALRPYGARTAVLAGYMRVLSPVLLDAFWDRERELPGVLNIHPADTRAYQGAHGYEFALGLVPGARRLSETRVTVHFVDRGVDTGPIIAQRRVPVLPDDDLERLRARGLAVEHELYPAVIRAYCEGRLSLAGGRVWWDGKPIELD